MKQTTKVGAPVCPDAGCPPIPSRRFRAGSFRPAWLQILLLLIAPLAMSVASLVQATTYTYDANGRLRSATTSSGATATYQYDVRGNLLSIGSAAASTMVITSFEPNIGMAGETVTIWGHGFSTVKAYDTVKIGGVAATIAGTPSATQLVVTVPTTAPPGPAPITVINRSSSPAISATSQDNFTVTNTGMPPSIGSVVDTTTQSLFTSGNSGDTITITGSNLYPVQNATTVTVDGVYAFALSPDNVSQGGTMTQTRIQFQLPAWVGSGPISVTTPYGTATYLSPLVVIPSGSQSGVTATAFNPVQLVSVSPATPATVSLGGANQANTVLLFSGHVGDFDTIQASGLAASGVNYYVQNPLGMTIISGTISSTAPTVFLPELYENGSYSVFFELGNGSATSFSVGVYSDPVLQLTGTATSAPLSVSTTVAGQGARVIIPMTQGANMGIAILSQLSNSSIADDMLAPDGTDVGNYSWGFGNCPSSGCARNLLAAPLTGPYQLKLAPGSGAGTMSVNLLLSQDQVAAMTSPPSINAQSVTFSKLVAGQNAWITFSTTNPNQSVDLSLSGIQTMQPSNAAVYVTLFGPDGTTTQIGGPTSAQNFNLMLNQPGNYRVFLDSQGGANYSPASLYSLTAAMVLNQSGVAITTSTNFLTSANPVATAQSFKTTQTGQLQSFTFYANQGDNLGLAFSGVGLSSDAGNSMGIEVIAPDGSMPFDPLKNLSGGRCSASGCAFNLTNVPVTGTYTVWVAPSDGNGPVGTMQFTVNLSLDQVAAINSSWPSAQQSASLTSTTGVPGQNGWFTFTNNTPNQPVTLSFSNIATSPQQNVQVYTYLYAPDGSPPTLYVLSPGTTPQTFNVTLSETGNYRIFVDPSADRYYTTAFTNVTLTLLGNPNGAALTTSSNPLTSSNPVATPQTYTTTVSGQQQTFTFFANQGDNLGLAFTKVSFVNTSSMSITVTAPDGRNNWPPSLGSCDTSGCAFNLTNAPMQGNYTVTATPAGTVGTMTFTANLTMDKVAAINSNLSSSPQSASFSGLVAGQNGWITFSTNAFNLPVTMSFSNVTTASPPNMQVYTYMYAPDGSPPILYIIPGGYSSQSFTFTLNEPGNYRLFIDPESDRHYVASLSSMTATFTAGTAGTITPPTGTSFSSYRSSQGGQQLPFTNASATSLIFYAKAGENLGLGFTGVSFGGSATQMGINVVLPDGNNWQNQNSQCGTSGCALHLMNAPETGTYQITVTPNNSGTATFAATLSLDQTASLTLNANGAPSLQLSQLPTGSAGQIDWLTYNNNKPGQQVSLSIAQSPSMQDCVVIYYPDGSNSINKYCYLQPPTGLNLTLSETGTYGFMLYQMNGSPFVIPSVTAVLVDDTNGTALTTSQTPLSQQNPTSTQLYKTTTAGQMQAFTFYASAGQNLGLAITGLQFSGGSGDANVSMTLPDGNTWYSQANNNCGNCAFDLVNVPESGTYTVRVTPNGGNLGTMSFTAILSLDQVAQVPLNAAATSSANLQVATLSTSVAGQNGWFTINNTVPGQTVSFGITNDAVQPSLTLFLPDGTSTTAGWGTSGASQGWNLTLNELGLYRIFVNPPGLSTLQNFTATLIVNQPGATLADPTLYSPSQPPPFTTVVSGQSQTFSFTANEGDNLGLTLSQLALSGGASAAAISVTLPDGSNWTNQSQQCYAPGCFINLIMAPETGTYGVTVTPIGGYANGTVVGTESFTATLAELY